MEIIVQVDSGKSMKTAKFIDMKELCSLEKNTFKAFLENTC